MTVEHFKRVIIDQREELDAYFKRHKIISREVDYQKLRGFLKHPNILVITGPRRCGKSILSISLLAGETYGYINFDDERLAHLETKDLNDLLQAFFELYGTDLEYFIFDEIQNVSGWQLFISRLRQNKKIIITGSNAKLLSGELATHLTGRYARFILYPFSFREYVRWRDEEWQMNLTALSTARVAKARNYAEEYLKLGGFPEALLIGSAMVKTIYSDIIEKDILYRHDIRHKKTFKEFAHYLVSSCGLMMNYAKLQKPFGIKNVQTVKNYFDYLSASFLIFAVEKFSFKLKEQVISPRKIYGIDTGLINAVSFQFSENYGHLLENAVFLELVRRKSYQHTECEIYYWADNKGREIDFVVKEGAHVQQLIQVSKQVNDADIKAREIKALFAGGHELRCGNFLVITKDFSGIEKIDGKTVTYMPLWQWLLSV